MSTRLVRQTAAGVLLAVVLAACSSAGSDPGPAPAGAGPGPSAIDDSPRAEPVIDTPQEVTADHLDEQAFRIRSSDQPFDFMASVAALAALGREVPDVLAELDYEVNAEVWAGDLTRAALTRAGPNRAATSAAALAILQRNSDGVFLTDEQVMDVRNFLSWAAVQNGYVDNHVVAAGLAVAAVRFEHEQDKLTNRDDLDFFRSPAVLCSSSEWQKAPWEVAAQFLVNGTEVCPPDQLAANWDVLARQVEERGGQASADRTRALEMVGLLNVVYDERATEFGEQRLRQFDAVRTAYLSGLGEDPWEWLWGYYKFEFDRGKTKTALDAGLTPAAQAALTYFAGRGMPLIQEVE